MDNDLHCLGVSRLATLIREKSISPVEVVDYFLTRISTIDPQLNTFVTVTKEHATRAAKVAEAEIIAGRYRGLMHGIPFSLKDIYSTSGIRTTAQSKLLVDHVPSIDATVVRRFYEAGAILLGKNATWEFAHGGPSWDIAFPPARNPWNTENDPGGSSSGSAAAIAAGLVLVSMGSDTGGSIRGPAAACGVVGFKPTYGRISRHGVLPNAFSHDHCGPLAWTVDDCAIAMNVVSGYDPLCPGSANVKVPDFGANLHRPIAGLKLGTPWHWLEKEASVTNETLNAFEESLRVFKDLGASIHKITLPPLQAYNDSKRIIAMAELFSIHAADLRARPQLFGDNMRYRIICGGLLSAEDYIQATRWRHSLAGEIEAAFREVDLIVTPTTGAPSGRLEPTPPESLFTSSSLTAPFNVSGSPAIALCNGFSVEGMPLSLQLAGRAFEEEVVLRTANAYEKATSWRGRRPLLIA